MPVESTLKLLKYRVKEMSFTLNESFSYSQKSISLSPTFKQNITKIDKDTAEVELIFVLKPDETEIPFSIRVNVEGRFSMNDWESEDNFNLMTDNTIAILFPYLRSIVTMLTANANVPPYVLPVVNIVEMLRHKKIETEE